MNFFVGVLTIEDTSANTNSEMETDSDSDNDHEPCNLRLKISDYISGAVDTCKFLRHVVSLLLIIGLIRVLIF